MGNIGAPEILVILVVALIVLGPQRLPDAAKQLGKALSEFRRVSTGLQAEMRDAFTEAPGSVEPKGTPAVIEPVEGPPSVDPQPQIPPATPADSEIRLAPDDPSLS